MHVAALAEALAGSRHADGTISLHQLDSLLSRAGLEELAHAVAALPERSGLVDQDESDGPKHPWF